MNTEPFASDLATRLQREASRSSAPTRRVMLYLPAPVYDRFRSFCDRRELSMTRAAQVFIEAGLNQVEAEGAPE